jgi:hypothetical protein
MSFNRWFVFVGLIFSAVERNLGILDQDPTKEN